MKIKLLSALAFCAIISANIFAQNPTTAGFLTMNVNTGYSCTPTCFGVRGLTLKGAHAIAMTPQQAASINENSTIRLVVDDVEFEFNLASDPNYMPGDTTADVTSGANFDGIPLNITARLSWNNTSLRIFFEATGFSFASGSSFPVNSDKLHNGFPHVTIGTIISGDGPTFYSFASYAFSTRMLNIGRNRTDEEFQIQVINIRSAHRIPTVSL